ncbi:MAG: DNA methyltransferase [Candidatus Micrarchaeota archaeon]
MRSDPLPWKQSPGNMGNRLHTICSYMAMFPPPIPHYFIKKYSEEGDVVLDPFSGRGTTSLEASMLNRVAIGSDKNPLAFVLTYAKVDVPSRERLIARINKLWTDYKKKDNVASAKEHWKVKMLFSNYTLKQLLFLKKRLRWKTNNVDAFITAMILGILHGGSEGYLSIQMPNTFSMSPGYVKKFIKDNGLKKNKRDVFVLLHKKLDRCYQKVPSKGKAYLMDARKLDKIKSSSVKLVLTSPPYASVIKYGAFNWIRLWFLNQDAKKVDRGLLCTQSLPLYRDFMLTVLKENYRVLVDGGVAVYVIGDVRKLESGKVINLAQFVWDECAKPLGYDLAEPIHADAIEDSTKVSKIWGKRRGDATKIDRVLVIRKPRRN